MKKLPESCHAPPQGYNVNAHIPADFTTTVTGDKTAKWNNLELEVQQIQVKVSFFEKLFYISRLPAL